MSLSNRPRPRIPHLPHPSALCLSTLGSLTSPHHTLQSRTPYLPHLLGLDVDGIYRVSGNLAVVQKLRFLVDRGEKACGQVEVLRMSCLRSTGGSEWGGWQNREVFRLELHVLPLDRSETSTPLQRYASIFV